MCIEEVCHTWLFLSNTTCSKQTLLDNHEKLENEIKVYNSEIERLKELSRQIFEFLMSGSVVSTECIATSYCAIRSTC